METQAKGSGFLKVTGILMIIGASVSIIISIVFALGVKLIFALLAVGGMATMWMAVFADTGTCLIVVANALRMLRAKPALDRMAAEAAGAKPGHPPRCPCCGG